MVPCLLGCSALGGISQPTWSGHAGLHPPVCQGGLCWSPCCHPGRHQGCHPPTACPPLPLLCVSRGTSGFLSSQSPVGWCQLLPHTACSRGWEVLPSWCSSRGSRGRWDLIPEFSGHHFPSLFLKIRWGLFF